VDGHCSLSGLSGRRHEHLFRNGVPALLSTLRKLLMVLLELALPADHRLLVRQARVLLPGVLTTRAHRLPQTPTRCTT